MAWESHGLSPVEAAVEGACTACDFAKESTPTQLAILAGPKVTMHCDVTPREVYLYSKVLITRNGTNNDAAKVYSRHARFEMKR